MILKSVYAIMAGWLFVNPNEVNSPLDDRTREKSRKVASVCICVTTRFLIVCPIFQCPAWLTAVSKTFLSCVKHPAWSRVHFWHLR